MIDFMKHAAAGVPKASDSSHRQVYVESDGTLYMKDESGNISRVSPGMWLRRTKYTSGTAATHTSGIGTRNTNVRVWGGGGGGGGVAGLTFGAGGAAGGAAGSKVEKLYANHAAGATFTYTVGAAGAGGTAGNNNGSDGSDSTFTDGTTLITGKGGGGGKKGDVSTTIIGGERLGGRGVISTNGDYNGTGEDGEDGQANVNYPSATRGGRGGNSEFGGAGIRQLAGTDTPATAGAAGAAATGLASGGGGAYTYNDNGNNRAGGAGGGGVIIVDEYS